MTRIENYPSYMLVTVTLPDGDVTLAIDKQRSMADWALVFRAVSETLAAEPVPKELPHITHDFTGTAQ